jgi:membrane dipeptidase
MNKIPFPMKRFNFILLTCILIFLIQCNLKTTAQQHTQSYQEIHSNAIVVDTHNDILTQAIKKGVVFDNNLKGQTHSDLVRWKQGGVDVQFFSIWCDGDKINPFDYAIRQMDTLDALANRNPDKIIEVANCNELLKVVNQQKMAAIFGVEGGHMIENDLSKLDYLYKRGARYLTLTWNNSTSWATSASDETLNKDLTHKGLTDFGKQVVHRMNELGMMIDVSHVGEQTFWDVINTTTKPIIASHSCVYNICPHPRNLKDEQIKAIAKNGGVIQINFYSGFLDSTYQKKKDNFMLKHKIDYDSLIKDRIATLNWTNEIIDYIAEEYLFAKYNNEVQTFRAPFSLLMQHIEYIIQLVGVDFVGLGSDFDGIESSALQLDDVASFPLITKSLVEKGYSNEDIDKILGRNILRVLKANEVNK